MLLTGTYPRMLDEKQRLALPRPIRDALGGSLTALYAAPGTDGTVSLYTEEVFGQLARHFESLPPTAEEIRAFSRLFYAQAHRLELDRQGRVRIPTDLVRLAGLDRELVLLGVRDHLELWNKVRWEEYLAQQQSRYDQIAERAFTYRSGEGPAGGLVAPQPAAPESSGAQPVARKPR